MEVGKLVRSSTNGKIEVGSMSSGPIDRAKLLATSCKVNGNHGNNVVRQQEQNNHPKDRTLKMFNKVQVVYYLTRNGQLEHPHYIEVSHLATQPLRLKDVIDRLTVLRGKTMPRQYSWSCKRSYKNGYVWNDLSENDAIYASEGTEYILKGSELLLENDFSETRDVHMKKREQRKDQRTRTHNLMSKSDGAHHKGHNYKQETTKSYEQDLNNGDDNEEDDEEEKGSCNSSNAPCTTLQMEEEESFSFPSTSSTNSDKQPPQTPPASQRFQPLEVPKTSTSESKTLEKDTSDSKVIEEDGDPAISTSLTRSNTILLHLIACGGGGIFAPQGENKPKCNGGLGGSRRNSNFSIMPCLKQQLNNRAISKNNNNNVPLRIKDTGDHQRQLCFRAGENNNQGQLVASNEDEDEDMMMVRYMSENPRFGNAQSEEKEYFSGTILETMAQGHQHTQSFGSASSYPHTQFPVLTKSSSYNEQRCSKSGIQVAGVTSTRVDEDDEKDDKKYAGIIKLCIPRKKSWSCSTRHC